MSKSVPVFFMVCSVFCVKTNLWSLNIIKSFCIFKKYFSNFSKILEKTKKKFQENIQKNAKINFLICIIKLNFWCFIKYFQWQKFWSNPKNTKNSKVVSLFSHWEFEKVRFSRVFSKKKWGKPLRIFFCNFWKNFFLSIQK